MSISRLSPSMKLLLLLRPKGASLQSVIEGFTGYVLDYKMQEPTGLIAGATNVAVPLGRLLNGLLYADYVAGAGWSNSGGQVAAHAGGGGTATLSQAGLLAIGKTFRIVTIVSGRTAGSVILTGTGAVAISADGAAVDNITALGTALVYTPTNDFDGSIDCATVVVKQTGIAASTDFPGGQELSTAGVGVMDLNNWTIVSGVDSLANLSADILRITSTVNPFVKQTPIIAGLCYRFTGEYRSDAGNNNRGRIFLGNANIAWDGTTSSDWQVVDVTDAAVGDDGFYLSQIGAGGYGEWRTWSLKLANPLNLANTGMSIAQPGAGNVPLVYSGDGVASRLSFLSITEYTSIFNMSNGGKMITASVDTWAAGIDVLWRSAVDANNEIYMLRSGSDLIWSYEVGGVASTVTLDTTTLPGGSPTGLFTMSMGWAVGGVGMQAFYRGAQQGTNQAIGSAIIGNLDITLTALFANNNSGGNSWAGDGGYPVLCNLTPTIADHNAYHQATRIP